MTLSVAGPDKLSEETSVQFETAPPAPSKKSLKKAAKYERYAALKAERRIREKESRKDKKRTRAEQISNGEIVEDSEEKKRQMKKPRLDFGGRVLVDLGFDDKMSDKEIHSLTSQLAYTYSANRQASYPFTLLFSSLNGRTFTRLEGISDAAYKRWIQTEWWEEGYDRLWSGVSDPQEHDNVKKTVVYLTADTDEELNELSPDETYIIGGICDHNRYKNLCLDRAKASGIRTARLPIGRYLANMSTRKVLTVNQVFEILLKWVETRDWEQALYAVMPKRKFQDGGKKVGPVTVLEKDILAGEEEVAQDISETAGQIAVVEDVSQNIEPEVPNAFSS